MPMIQSGSLLDVCDNSGARTVSCITPFKSSGSLGDILRVSVRKAHPRGKIRAGSVQYAVVTHTRAPCAKKDGQILRSDANMVVLTTKEGSPLGTRVLKPLPHLFRGTRRAKLLSLAPSLY
jgi:large subunit ribosomal protein L14